MIRRHVQASVAAGLLSAGAAGAQEFDLPFRLINESPLTIIEFRVMGHDEDDWSGNLLRRGPILPDEVATFILRDAADVCEYQMAIYFHNRTYMLEDVNVCDRGDFIIRDPR